MTEFNVTFKATSEMCTVLCWTDTFAPITTFGTGRLNSFKGENVLEDSRLFKRDLIQSDKPFKGVTNYR